MHGSATAALPFETVGDGRPTVLFIHGFLDAGRVWEPVAERLAQAGVASAVLDLPGMGGTPAEPETISLDSYADSVAAVVDALGGDLLLVGQSMGAQVAELVALRRPAQVKALVLLTPVPLGGVGAPDEVAASFKAVGGNAEVQIAQRTQLSPNLSYEALTTLVHIGEQVRPDVAARLVDMWNQGHEAGTRPSAFTGPVMVVRGGADPFIDEAAASTVAGRFARVTSAEVEGAGHWAHVEQPEKVAELVLGALSASGLTAASAGGAASDWKGAFAKQSSAAFGQAFAAGVVLEASSMIAPVRGRKNVQRVMEAASKVYRSLTFTDQASAGAKQYVEWVAEAHEGVAFAGVTVLTRDDEGAIVHVAIHHRPMDAAIFFSRKMGESLSGVIGPGHFLGSGEQLGEAA
ncbi:MAG: alpha/beta hydrolase [Bradyrhizobium sp.]|nr:alpha/beta hydrolase [Bradyrhizobium sp.]